MKKALAFSIAVAYVASALSSVFAVEMTDDTQTINAEYTVNSTYEVTIPASIVFNGYNDAQNISVTASDVFLHNRESLHISMTSENGALVNGDSSIPYTLEIGDAEAVNITKTDTYDLLSVEAGDIDGDSAALVFTSGDDTNVILAGRHADTLTFSVRPEITSLAGTTWKFNDNISDYSIFGENSYDYETGRIDFIARGYMNEGSDRVGNVSGFEYRVIPYEGLDVEYLSQVGSNYLYIYVPTIEWIDGVTYSGWTIASSYDAGSYLRGEMDLATYASILIDNFGIDAPTMHFIVDENSDTRIENSDFIDWMYKNATLIDAEVLE